MSLLAMQEPWRPDAPAKLIVADPAKPFPVLAVTLGVVGGLLGACVLTVLILRWREWLYQAHAATWAARRAASALKLSRGETTLAKKLADAGASPTTAVLVSGEVLRACAQALCDRGISAAERARVADMCERYGVRAPELNEDPPKVVESAQARPVRKGPAPTSSKKVTNTKAAAPPKRKAG